MARDGDDSKTSGRHNDDGADELQSDSQPSVGANRGEVSLEVGIDTPFVLELESLLLSVGSNSRDTSQRLLEVSVDGAAANAVQSLELARRPEVVALDPVVRQSQGDDEGDECRRRD